MRRRKLVPSPGRMFAGIGVIAVVALIAAPGGTA